MKDDKYIDRAVNYSPESILASIKDFYETIFNGPDDELKRKVRRIILALSAALSVGP